MKGLNLQVQVNGESQEVSEGATIAELLDSLKLPRRYVAVERNAVVVPRLQHGETRLAEGDCLEIVTLVGGG